MKLDTRYSVNPEDFKRYTTEEVRKEFLISDLFQDDVLRAVYSHIDRMVVFGCKPVHEAVSLDKDIDVYGNFGTKFILERRELGVFNIGGDGTISVDGTVYELAHTDCLYISMGSEKVVFASKDAANPAKFYMVSAPAHKPCKTTHIAMADAAKRPCGSMETANDRVINQFIHPDVLETCQLSMGLTQLKTGSVWNTMPAHTHERRMEIYFYFDVSEGNAVFHFMGQPQQTRHVVMRNEEAILNPSWSIHSGAGTTNYSFIWAMGGENKTFDDMDNLNIVDMR